MPPRASRKGRTVSKHLAPILVVVALCIPTALVGSGAMPTRTHFSFDPVTSPHATISPGSSMLEAARASLASHQGPAALPPPPPPPPPTNWTLVNTSNASSLPAPRQLQSMAYDPVDDYVVMFGGGNVNPVGQVNDTWVFSNGTWTQLFPNPAPAVRRSASLAWDAADGYLVLFGGLNPGSFLSNSVQFQDTWSFLHGVWTNRTAATMNASNTPSTRWNAPMEYDPVRGATILFGGCDTLACAASTNDTWAYVGGNWTNITSSVGAAPSVRGTESVVWYTPDQALLLFGGSNPNQTVLGDTWELGSTGWTQLTPPTSPPAGGDSWMIYDNVTANVVLFGGFRYSVSPSGYAVAETWTYANGTWTNQTLNNSIAPSPRWGMQQASAYDASRGCGYLFGGADSNDVNLGDTWTYGCTGGGTGSGGGGSGSGGSGNGGNGTPRFYLNVTPSSGTAPLFFNASAQVTPVNASINYTLLLAVHGPGGSRTAWNDSLANWSGQAVTIAGVVSPAGSYYLIAEVDEFASGSWTLTAFANLTLVATAPVGTPPSIAMTVTPSNGTAPLNLTLSITPSGGSAPYNLSVCAEGPLSQPNATGACASIASQTGFQRGTWTLNDSLSSVGNYTIIASVTDSAGLSANATASAVVGASAALAPLAVKASGVAPAVTTVAGATYAFTTTVFGGVAPYDVQWAFGDGTSGSAVPGTIVHHTYTASGTYTATLTVTDAVGRRATASVGPLVVSLPFAGTASTVSWGSAVALGIAVVVGILAATGIGITTRQLLRRREALNWLREVEEPRSNDEPAPGTR